MSTAHAMIMALQQLVQMPGLLLRCLPLRSLPKVTTKEGQVVVPWKLVLGHRVQEATKSLLHSHGSEQQCCHAIAVGQSSTRKHAPQPTGTAHQPVDDLQRSADMSGHAPTEFCK